MRLLGSTLLTAFAALSTVSALGWDNYEGLSPRDYHLDLQDAGILDIRDVEDELISLKRRNKYNIQHHIRSLEKRRGGVQHGCIKCKYREIVQKGIYCGVCVLSEKTGLTLLPKLAPKPDSPTPAVPQIKHEEQSPETQPGTVPSMPKQEPGTYGSRRART